jgi:restriction system protein
MKNRIKVGKAEVHWSASGNRITKYSLEMYDEGLKEHKIVSAPELDILQNKVDLQTEKWNEKWDKVESKQRNIKEKEASIEEAVRRTEEAIEATNAIDNLLNHTLNIDDTIDWDVLKKMDKYSKESPSKPMPKKKRDYPPKPIEEKPIFTFMDKILKSKKERKILDCEKRYADSLSKWEEQKLEVDNYNLNLEQEYEAEIDKWNDKVKKWKDKKKEFEKEQTLFNKKIENMKQAYLSLDEASIIEYCEMVLENSVYPESFPKSYQLEYNSSNSILIVEYQLPSIESLPTLKEVKYLASKKELKEAFLSESQLQKMFDETIYKITLRTLHELFEADKAEAITAISFNGWVESINKANGKEENNCILTIQVKKEEFKEIDLSNVDPKICFKNLKGVASSKLSSLSPVNPILQISKTDKRFVESYDVANQLDETTNLAAMDWEDFEHLIRELFEKEFQSNGGEVKVTQASRDGGVDAVAFDPDPIRGGKIVIQAKRYTNTVGLSAIRDLYGTVVNEGATKGILVSTADYGPDAYEFARGKPLTLLNGSNLLHLLEKHGHRAKIDLREAKKILSEK